MQFHDDLFLLLHRMSPKARVFLCSLPEQDLGNKDVAYRKLSFAGFHKEAHSIFIMDDIDYGLLLLNLPTPARN
jgi:hypothetical protein